MDDLQIRRVRSGVEDSFAWVTLWFCTDARNLDVLHIVCSKTAADPITGHLYMERYDQSIACYGGAKIIVEGSNGIDLHLNNKCMKSLMLESSMTLVAPEESLGWKKAIRVFQEMANYPTGRVIESAWTLSSCRKTHVLTVQCRLAQPLRCAAHSDIVVNLPLGRAIARRRANTAEIELWESGAIYGPFAY
jgi:hypothetical protein